MKIALLYSGLASGFSAEILDNHKRYIIDHYDCDIYLSTYNTDNYEPTLKLLNPIKYNIQDWVSTNPLFEQIAANIKYKPPETKPINTLSMFYQIQKCFSLVENNIYNAIIRLRFDITFDTKLDIIMNQNINIPQGGDHWGGILDLFAYGSFDIMKKYSQLYDKINEYITSNSVIFHPESMLRFYLNECGVPINRFPYNIYLRNQLFTT